MSDFDRESDALFARTRDAFDPRPEDEARIRRALAERIAAVASSSHSADTATNGANGVSRVPRMRGRSLRRRAALVAAAAAVIGAAAFAYGHRRGSPQDPPRPNPAPTATIAPASTASDPPPVMTTAPPFLPEAAPRASRSARVHAPAAAPPFGEEVALLARMQDLWRARELNALAAAVAEHERRFPNGVLSEEREAMKTMLQCERADTAPAASALAAAFAARHPASPHTSRVLATCGAKSQP